MGNCNIYDIKIIGDTHNLIFNVLDANIYDIKIIGDTHNLIFNVLDAVRSFCMFYCFILTRYSFNDIKNEPCFYQW